MTQPPNNSQDQEQQQTANAAILLIGSAADQRKFQLALGRIDELTIAGTRQTGTQTGIQVTIPAEVDALAYLKSVVTSLPGVSVRIQGVMIKTVPTVVCKATAASDRSGSRRFGLLPRRSAPQRRFPSSTRTPQPATFRTEVEGIRQQVVREPIPAPALTEPLQSSSSAASENSLVKPSTLFTGIFFLFGDVELGLAKVMGASNENKTLQNTRLPALTKSAINNSITGLLFMFGDLEVGIQRVRNAKTAFSMKRLTEVSLIFGVASSLISMLAGALFGSEPSEKTDRPELPESEKYDNP